MTNSESGASDLFLEHINNLLHAQKAPELSPEIAANPVAKSCHDSLMALRDIVKRFANGDLHEPIVMRGPIAGSLKAIQANMLHVTWQIQQVAAGDFSQRVDFMGDFSTAFNSMAEQLDNALTELKMSKDELEVLNRKMAAEAETLARAVELLKESEARHKYLAEHDPLTGVLNRRSFFRLAEMELRRCQLAGRCCSLALMDIDRFKAFNDHYGHLEGDKVLRLVGDAGRRTMRDGDAMGRYGGEEFVFLFSGCDVKEGVAAAERVRHAISASPVTLADGGKIGITISAGLVIVEPDMPGPRDRRLLRCVVQAADRALYEAKNEGRDCLRRAPFTYNPFNSGGTEVFIGD